MFIEKIKIIFSKMRLMVKIRKLERKKKQIITQKDKAKSIYYRKYWKNSPDFFPYTKCDGKFYFYQLHCIDENDLYNLIDQVVQKKRESTNQTQGGFLENRDPLNGKHTSVEKIVKAIMNDSIIQAQV